MGILWPKNNDYGCIPLVLTTLFTASVCIIIDPETREYVSDLFESVKEIITEQRVLYSSDSNTITHNTHSQPEEKRENKDKSSGKIKIKEKKNQGKEPKKNLDKPSVNLEAEKLVEDNSLSFLTTPIDTILNAGKSTNSHSSPNTNSAIHTDSSKPKVVIKFIDQSTFDQALNSPKRPHAITKSVSESAVRSHANQSPTSTLVDDEVGYDDDEGANIMYVCTKCQRQDYTVCGRGYYSCMLTSGDANIGDIEDMITPVVNVSSDDGKRKKTGRILYENLCSLRIQQEKIASTSTCFGNNYATDSASPRSASGFLVSPCNNPASHVSGAECAGMKTSRLKILPVNCLGTCSSGNVIAFRGQDKYSYQFGNLDETDPEDLMDILEFANQYVESSDGFSKQKTRPPKMKRNCFARIPPLSKSFRNLVD